MPSRSAPIEPPTLEEMRRTAMWLRLICIHCQHERPALIVHLQIAFGIAASSDRVRSRMPCLRCGLRGCHTYLPSHVDSQTGAAPFPGYPPRA